VRLVPYSGDDRVEIALIERKSHQALTLDAMRRFLATNPRVHRGGGLIPFRRDLFRNENSVVSTEMFDYFDH
jgi:hypothetical protein